MLAEFSTLTLFYKPKGEPLSNNALNIHVTRSNGQHSAVKELLLYSLATLTA